MFGDYYKAQLRKSGQGIKVDKKHGDKKVMTIGLQYNFDAGLAHAIGPRAESIRQMLINSGDAAIRMSGTSLTLDTDTCSAKIKHRVKKSPVVHEIEATTGIGIKASTPTANETEPTLEVSLQLPMEESHMGFVEQYLGEGLYVRLDKQQLPLPLEEPATEEE